MISLLKKACQLFSAVCLLLIVCYWCRWTHCSTHCISWKRAVGFWHCIKFRFSPFGKTKVQFSSATQSHPTLCDPMNRSTPGLHQLPESTQTHVHWVGDAIQPSHPVVPFSSCPQSFPASESFQMSQLFASGGQSIGVSASTSVPPMNTQDWSPLGWTGWISL